MTNCSKFFYGTISHVLCNELTHEGTCFQSTIENFTRTIPGCTKFVLPLALVNLIQYSWNICNLPWNWLWQYFVQIPIIMKIRNLDANVFSQSFHIFVDYFLGAYLISGLGLTNICVFRWVDIVFSEIDSIQIYFAPQKAVGLFPLLHCVGSSIWPGSIYWFIFYSWSC